MIRPYILADTNWKHLKDEDFELAILPWGATEAHNYHLPYSTDVIEGTAIAEEAGRIAWSQYRAIRYILRYELKPKYSICNFKRHH
jgi:creatinine amidohydrolase